jgi:hypothetical protein
MVSRFLSVGQSAAGHSAIRAIDIDRSADAGENRVFLKMFLSETLSKTTRSQRTSAAGLRPPPVAGSYRDTGLHRQRFPGLFWGQEGAGSGAAGTGEVIEI